ncbi:hypothetical protein AAFN60_10090 [Roseibacillus persicicus]|uniref:hypothetical protein n=1 Tax=Roseibacillus persicicus TaxID=454148 RepID=UPI00398B92D0
MAANERQTAFVNTDGLSTYSNGAVHFEASAQIAIGEASAAQMLALEANDSDRDGLLTTEETSLTTDTNLADSDGDGQNDGLSHQQSNEPVVLKEIDFPDFASSEVQEFRLYGHNVDAANGGIRFDDIKLYGTGDSEPPVEDEVDSLFLRIELQP